jgi:hypothetical protein
MPVGEVLAERVADEAAVPRITASEVASNPTGLGDVEQLAFAVKIHNTKPAAFRASTGVPGATVSPTSARTEESDSNTAMPSRDAGTRPAGKARNADDEQAAPNVSEKGADKKPSQDGVLESAGGSGSSSVIQPWHANSDESSVTLAGSTDKPVPSSPNAPNATDEPVVPNPPVVPSAPMNEIFVRVESHQGQNVDLRITQRAGDLQIAVNSSDLVTTEGLRHGLSELTNRLNESGYQAEAWHPGHPTAAADSAGNSGNSSRQQSSGNSQSNSGWSQQNRGQRDNNPSNSPRRTQEFKTSLTGAAQSTGQFHGLLS